MREKTSPKGFSASKCDVGIFFHFYFEIVKEFFRIIFGGIFLAEFFWRIFLGGFFWRIFLEDFFGRIIGRIFWEEFFVNIGID